VAPVDHGAPPGGDAPGPVAHRRWWERNRLWVFLLVPLLALALASSGFRLVRIYLPWNYSRPQIAHASAMTFSQDWRYNSRLTFHRQATIKVRGVTVVDAEGGRRAAPGATLYRVELQLDADPDVLMTGCDIMLLGPDGTRYGVSGAKVDIPGADQPFGIACVPAEAPGPTVDVVTDEVTPSDSPRPTTWTIVTSVALPSAVKPTQVRVQWTEPDYAVLDVPS